MDYRETKQLVTPIVALSNAMDGRQSTMWTAIPATIAQVNDLQGQITIHAQPTIQAKITGLDQSTKLEALPVLPDVPVVFPRGGGYALTFPLQVGDEVLIVFSSRSIDNWWDKGGVQKPFEPRMHDINDGFAIPGPFSKPQIIPNVSTSTVQLRNNSQSQYVEIDTANKIVRLVCDSDTVTLNSSANTIDVNAGNTKLHLASGGASSLDCGGGTFSIVNASAIHLD